jgi:hypothetical protein
LRLEPHVKGFFDPRHQGAGAVVNIDLQLRRYFSPSAVCRRISSSKVSSMRNLANTGPLPGEMKSMSAALSQTM